MLRNRRPETQERVQLDHSTEVAARSRLGRTGKVARSGLAWTMTGQWASFGVQIITTAVLARLIAPKDFGLVSEALTLTALAGQLQEFGLSQAVIQRTRLTHGQLSNLFWVNVGAGGLLTLFIAACSPALALFYGDARLTALTSVLALTYLIAGFGVQHGALMARQMQFKSIALRSLVPRVIGGGVAIAAAVAGAGYWALAFQQLVGSFFASLFVWTAVRWRPGRPRRRTGVRPLLRFGAGVSVANILFYFSSNADNILVGGFLGQAPLGLYSRAYNLFLVPLRQIHGPLGGVVQPVLAALANEPERYRRFYCRVLSAIAILGIPLVAFMAVMSREVIVVVLGARWAGASEPFRWLAVAGFLALFTRTFTWVFTTTDRARAMAISAAVTTPLVVASFAIGLHWGITGVAAAQAVCRTILVVPSIWYATRNTPIQMSDVVSAAWRPALIGGGAALVALLIKLEMPSSSALTVLAVATVAALASLALMFALWPAAREELKDLRLVSGRAKT